MKQDIKVAKSLTIASYIMLLLLPPIGIFLGLVGYLKSKAVPGSSISNWASIAAFLNLVITAAWYFFLYKTGILFCEVDCGI